MTNEELDEARAKEAGGDPVKAARLAREGWTPTDPDLLAFREWWRSEDGCDNVGQAYLAGARMARKQERERAKGLVEYVEADARRLDSVGGRALAKYRGEA
jgi:hypothetical protein